jgi:hypothetical protein
VRRVVERLVRLGVGVERRGEVDRAVTRCALRYWSAFRARLAARELELVDDGSLASERVEDEVRLEVAGRVMEALRTWMRPDVSFAKAEELFERLGLMEVERMDYGGARFT